MTRDQVERATTAWTALTACLVRAPAGQLLVKDGPRRGDALAALWPLGEVLAAAAAMLPLDVIDRHTTVEPLLRGLERYRAGHGYGPFPGDRTRYFDDNAWIALDLLQLGLLIGDSSYEHQAAELFEFIGDGEGDDGGVLWVEGQASRNTCSTGPAAQVALRLFAATRESRYLDFARRQLDFLRQRLRGKDGLYADHVRADGSVEPTVWSYNQGTPIGAMVLMSRITGEREWLQLASETAHAAMRWFEIDDRLWRSPPVFNAVYFRNLLALVAASADASLLEPLDRYLDRVWREARHRRTGLFVRGGIGSYDGRPAIDHAGITQLLAFRAWDPERWPDIC